MPRRLPWLKAESTATTKPLRQKLAAQPHPDSNDNGPPARRQTSRLGTLARPGRTPSTSPPPTPPPNDLMRDGLDGDDIYIMVEDEFHAVAKMFTQHLHHAEYLRLKKLAKGRTASAESTISRPVDSITAMRNETKKKKQAESRDIRTNAALQQIKGGATRPACDDSGQSDADNAHWRGTALQDLMTVSPTKNQISLTGLHGVKSRTRAAAGYSKAESRPSQPKVKAIDLRPNTFKPTLSTKPALSEGSTLDESSTDDLDAPTARSHLRASKPPRIPAPHRSPLQSSPPPKVHHQNPPPPPPPPPLLSSSRLKHTHSPHSYPTPDSDSNSDSNSNPHSSPNPAGNSSHRNRPARITPSRAAARRRLKARISRRETERETGAGAGAGVGVGGGNATATATATANINDIPVFLV